VPLKEDPQLQQQHVSSRDNNLVATATFDSIRVEEGLPVYNSIIRNEAPLFQVFPNPLKEGNITLLLKKDYDKAEIIIRNANGSIIFEERTSAKEKKISSGVFPAAGLYIITLIKNEKVFNAKLMIL
jgi:hypothetical protein